MAFAAGLISFLSPCVLPLVPGYISFISGVSFGEIREKEGSTPFLSKEKRIILYSSIFFIIGFSMVFILLGATATWIGTFISSKISILTKFAGLVIIFFGIYMMGLIRPHFGGYSDLRRYSGKCKPGRFSSLNVFPGAGDPLFIDGYRHKPILEIF